MIIKVKNKGTLEFKDFTFKCCFGLNGLTKNKKEGDKKTPIGTFSLGKLFYRADKYKKPITNLKCVKINKKIYRSRNSNFIWPILFTIWILLITIDKSKESLLKNSELK